MTTWRMYASSMSDCGRISSSVRHEITDAHSGELATSATESQPQATKLIWSKESVALRVEFRHERCGFQLRVLAKSRDFETLTKTVES